MLEALEPRWPSIRRSWARSVGRDHPELRAHIAALGRINIDPYAASLARGEVESYIGGVREQGEVLARAAVPFPVLMHSLHLFEERCVDAVRSTAGAGRSWAGLSSFDRIMHAGIASMAEGYFGELARAHAVDVLAQVRDTAATLGHRVNTPLLAIAGQAEVLSGRVADTKDRERVEVIRRCAERIGRAVEELTSAAAFQKVPYLGRVNLVEPL